MMMQHDFSTWLQEHYTALELEFLELLESYRYQPGKKTIHQMRLNLKRQLAFFSIMEPLLPSEVMDQQVVVIQQLQKRLGKVRNAQVQRQKAKVIEQALELDAAVSEKLKQREKEYADAWHTYFEEANLAAAMQGVRESLAVAFSHLSSASFAGNFIEQMRHLLYDIKGLSNISTFDTSKFHELRTHLKRLNFYMEWLQPFFQDLPFSEATAQDVRQLEQQIGEWHDYVSLLKKVDKTDQEEPFAFAVQEQIELHTLQVRALLPELEHLLKPLEAYFISSNSN